MGAEMGTQARLLQLRMGSFWKHCCFSLFPEAWASLIRMLMEGGGRGSEGAVEQEKHLGSREPVAN